MLPEFEWDENKANANLIKHGISFEEAAGVFADPSAVIFADEAHSGTELREILIGHSTEGRLVLVCFTERGRAVRIISARRANQRERRDYEQHTDG